MLDAAAPLSFAQTRTLGVRLAGDGVDVAVAAHHATAVQFCLIDRGPNGELHERRLALFGPLNGIWHAHIPGVGAGQRYGLRADGPWNPTRSHLYNPAKLLLDPYAGGLDGEPKLGPTLCSHQVNDDLAPTADQAHWVRDPRDSAADMAYGVVVDESFDWGDSRRPATAWERTVIYETHIRGLTMQHPGLPEALRGTYAGLAHPVVIEHLRRVGVTAVELLPIYACLSEPDLTQRGLANYWGYSTLGFFAPNARYATAEARARGPQAVNDEVKGMVRLLHEAGIEVILDVVYNHTCEVGLGGPTLSWRGLDNLAWYLHDGSTPARYADFTGTGNTVDFRRPEAVGWALDSLRHWAEDYQVDGFRYDLAVTLGRGPDGFDRDHPFLVGLLNDPALRGLKHIAEPWDLGPGGWQTGSFPVPMAAWNDHFRGDVRSFWLQGPRHQSEGGAGAGVRDLATRLSGSADLFSSADPMGRHGPAGSINFITAHDGFTLADLVTYDHKRNWANGENNLDGTDDNRSWNHGVEGPVAANGSGAAIGADAVYQLRTRTIRNLLATMAFAAGVPMLTAGDEMLRTQQGNNNAYCQDGPISWVDWDLPQVRQRLIETTAYLFQLRRDHAVLRPERFFTGAHREVDGPPDLGWFTPDGGPMATDQWFDPSFHAVQMLRGADSGADRDALVLVNGGLEAAECCLVPGRVGAAWELAWDSTWETPSDAAAAEEANVGPDRASPGQIVPLAGQSIRLYLSTPAAA